MRMGRIMRDRALVRGILVTMTAPTVLLGVPTALGGHLSGMEQTPARLRELGLRDRLPGPVVDAGDVAIEPGFRDDPDPRAKNRALIAGFLPRQRDLVAAALRGVGEDARLAILGGDCTAHAGALAGLRSLRPGARLAIAWFDAHGDYNTPATTPSGNVWGMPFAMICGRGDPDLVAACDGPTVDPHHAALLGGQVLDATESRMLAADGVAQFGSGMLGTPAGQASLAAWAAATAAEVDGLYVAVDFDVLDASGDWAVQMPEPAGLSPATTIASIRSLASGGMPILGFGATGINVVAGGDVARTVDAAVAIAEAALGGQAVDDRRR
jgi:arginase